MKEINPNRFNEEESVVHGEPDNAEVKKQVDAKPSEPTELNVLPRIERINGEMNPEIVKDQPSAGGSSSSQQSDDNQATPQSSNDSSTSTSQTSTTQSTDDDSPQIADDADLIEKEWVDKAKELVDRTKSDPRQQNIALNKMKADYLKKRFNKVIKTEKEG
jgi:hypothetical protein